MEARKIIENVQGIYGGKPTDGTIRLTDFHLVFCAPVEPSSNSDPSKATPPKIRERWITFPMFAHCTFRPTAPTSRQPPSIRIRCRDFTFVTFNFADSEVARDVFEFVKSRTCKLGTVEKLYAFSHKPLKHERDMDGWNFYDPRTEFKRQGISEKLADKGWRITTINKDYSFCDTYPALMAVPSSISDNVLKYAREFRSRNRIPALSYIHPVNNCTITRCSQPLAGIARKTNVQDEKLVAASFSAFVPAGSEDTTPLPSQSDVSDGRLSQDPGSESLDDELAAKSAAMFDEKTGKRLIYGAQQRNMIVDARPTINAIFNQIQGMGSENMERYPYAERVFLNIENIHVMRSSLNKVIESLKDADITPLPPNRELLHNSGWLRHIHNVLEGAGSIAERIGIHHSHVLIHCSDGWDRTSQLSALAQIMLDPFYRTIDGFIVLVEKDWLSFGHMFRLRSGHLNHEEWFTVQKDAMAGSKIQPGENDGRNDAFKNVLTGAKRFFNQQNKNEDPADLAAIGETASSKTVNDEATTPKMISPVFHQFLDCTYQLLRQNPTRFEYNERFLRRLLYHLYSCQYGTFLYNSEKQRRDARAAERTSSVWDYFLCRKQEFTNPDYEQDIDDHVKGRERLILPRLKEIRWWAQAFNRKEEEMNGALNAAAIAEHDRLTAVADLQYPSVVQSVEPESASAPAGSPSLAAAVAPVMSSSQPDLTLNESAREDLTPAAAHASLQRSASVEEQNPMNVIKEGIAGLNMAKGMMSGLGRSSEPTPAQQSVGGDQELREMA